jgi:hypothetical protein
MGRRRDRTTRRVATSKNAGTMMRMSVGMIGGASGLMYGVAYRLMCGVAYHLMYGVAYHLMYRVANRLIYGVANHLIYGVAYHLMSAGVNGRARGVTEIVATGPTPAPGMAATTHCRMANAGLTFGAEPTRPMS